MKPVIELIIFVGFIVIISFLALIFKEAKETKDAVVLFTNQFIYEEVDTQE